MPPAPLWTGTGTAPLELITTAPTAGPDIDLRQVAPSNYYVTLTLTRDYTTYTTTILLAGTESPATPRPSSAAIVDAAATTTTAITGPATTITTAIASSVTTTTAAVAPPVTTTVPAPVAQTTTAVAAVGSTDPSSGTIVGAIVGAIVGSIVFVLLLWVCFYTPTIFAVEASTVSGSTRSSSSGSTAKRSSRRARRVRVRETTKVRVRELDDD
jgi:hypothetical protein